MNINITVDGVDMTTVIDQRFVPGADGEQIPSPVTLGEAVALEITSKLMETPAWQPLRKQVEELRTEEIREQLRPIIAAAIQAPVQRTNSYGIPIGEPVSLTELIMTETREYLTRRDGYDRGTVLQKWLREAVDAALKQELRDTVKAEKAKVVAAVQAKAAELIAQAVKEGIGR